MMLTPRQIQIFDYIVRFVEKNRFAPTIAEILKHFGLNSPATVHEQLTKLEEAKLIRRIPHVQRGIEVLQNSYEFGEGSDGGLGLITRRNELPLLGVVAAGSPIEAVLSQETITVSPEMFGQNRFALKVRGDSMIEDQIADGDFIIVERTNIATNGQTIVALVDDHDATVKRYYNENGQVRLQPANEKYQPIFVNPPDRLKIQGIVVGLMRRYK